MPKIKLSDARKAYLKQNFDKINRRDLSGEDKRYWTLINNGKNRSKAGVRFEGRFIGGELVDTIKKVAQRKGVSVKSYLKDNQREVEALIESGFTQLQKKPETVIDLISSSKRKTVEIVDEDGNVQRVGKLKAIERIAEMQQWAASNTTIVQLGILTKMFLSGKVRISLPAPGSFDDMSEEEFENLLDSLEIWYVKSEKAKA